MFYPVEALKRGGRFHLCWVADSWPLRFATITHRQLLSQDIRKSCNDLLEVMTNESGRPTRRFSLRLSSQLLRGLARIYQRKVNIFLGELCMLNANVTKHINKKFMCHDEVVTSTPKAPPRLVIEEPLENEGVEEMIQRSGNVVANIEDITLKEATLPAVPPLLDDNFGELNPYQPLADKTLEMMMAQEVFAAQHSMNLSADVSTEKSVDKSRLVPHEPQMERISEHDATLFPKSLGEQLLQIGDISKDIPGIPDIPEIPDLPEIPPPALCDPQPEIQIPGKDMECDEDKLKATVAGRKTSQPEVVVLEELEDTQPPVKRRRMKSKIIDKNIKLPSNLLRSRIDKINLELRCETSSEDIVNIRVPPYILLARPARAGHRVSSALGVTPSSLFVRNLGIIEKHPRAEREMEEMMFRPVRRPHTRSVLEIIYEKEELLRENIEPPQIQPEVEQALEAKTVPQVTVQDLADLPAQAMDTLSQETRKRTGEPEQSGSPKILRRSTRSNYKSFKESLQLSANVATIPLQEAHKENIPENILQDSSIERNLAAVSSMLNEAGIADLAPEPVPAPQSSPRPLRPRANGSERSETPLGSLDRTKVSLCDSDKTTESMRFIRDRWGTVGTMIKIILCVKQHRRPLDVRTLVDSEPATDGFQNIAMARCFTSILKLKQHGFICIHKNPDTLEIKDITLGPKFISEAYID